VRVPSYSLSGLREMPIEVTIRGVSMLLEKSPLTPTEIVGRFGEAQRAALRAAELLLVRFRETAASAAASVASAAASSAAEAKAEETPLLTAILDNLKITLEDVHIRFEDASVNPTNKFAIGVTCRRFATTAQPSEEAAKRGLVRRIAAIDSLGVYWDTVEGACFSALSEPEQLSSLAAGIVDASRRKEASGHSFVLEPFSPQVEMLSNTHNKPGEPGMDIRGSLGRFRAHFSEAQFRDLTFLTRWLTFKRFRPVERPKGKTAVRQWWWYAVRALGSAAGAELVVDETQKRWTGKRARNLMPLTARSKAAHSKDRKPIGVAESSITEVETCDLSPFSSTATQRALVSSLGRRRAYISLFKRKLWHEDAQVEGITESQLPEEQLANLNKTLEWLEAGFSVGQALLFRLVAADEVGLEQKRRVALLRAREAEARQSWLGSLLLTPVDRKDWELTPAMRRECWFRLCESEHRLQRMQVFEDKYQRVGVDLESAQLALVGPISLPLRATPKHRRAASAAATASTDLMRVDLAGRLELETHPNSLSAAVNVSQLSVTDGTSADTVYPLAIQPRASLGKRSSLVSLPALNPPGLDSVLPKLAVGLTAIGDPPVVAPPSGEVFRCVVQLWKGRTSPKPPPLGRSLLSSVTGASFSHIEGDDEEDEHQHVQVVLRSQPLQIVVPVPLVERLVGFFASPAASAMSSQLITSLATMRQDAGQDLYALLEGRPALHIDVSVGAPLVVVPMDVRYPTKGALVADLGHLAFATRGQVHGEGVVTDTPGSDKHMSLLTKASMDFDRWHLALEDARVAVIPPYSELSSRKIVPVLHRLQAALDLDTCVLPATVAPTQARVSGALPRVSVSATPELFAALVTLLGHVDQIVQVVLAAESTSSEEAASFLDHAGQVSSPLTDESRTTAPKASEVAADIQADFQIGVVDVHLGGVQAQDSADELFLVLLGLSSSGTASQRALKGTVGLKAMHLVSCSGSSAPQLLVTSETKSSLLTGMAISPPRLIEIEYVQLLEPPPPGSDRALSTCRVEMQELELNWRPRLIEACQRYILHIVDDLASALTAPPGGAHLPGGAKEGAAPATPVAARAEAARSFVMFRLDAQVRKIQVNLCLDDEADSILASVLATEMALGLASTSAGQFDLTSALRDFVVEDPESTTFSRLVGRLRDGASDGDLLTLRVSVPPDEATSTPTHVDIAVQPVGVVFFMPQFDSLLDYILDGILGSLLAEAAEAAGDALSSSDDSSRVTLDIQVAGPTVCLPWMRGAEDTIVGRLGAVRLQTVFSDGGVEHIDPPRSLEFMNDGISTLRALKTAVVESLVIRATDLKLFACPTSLWNAHTEASSSAKGIGFGVPIALDGFTTDLAVHRPIALEPASGVTLDSLGMIVDASVVSPLHLVLTPENANSVVRVLVHNLGETAPSSKAATTVGSVDGGIRVNVKSDEALTIDVLGGTGLAKDRLLLQLGLRNVAATVMTTNAPRPPPEPFGPADGTDVHASFAISASSCGHEKRDDGTTIVSTKPEPLFLTDPQFVMDIAVRSESPDVDLTLEGSNVLHMRACDAHLAPILANLPIWLDALTSATSKGPKSDDVSKGGTAGVVTRVNLPGVRVSVEQAAHTLASASGSSVVASTTGESLLHLDLGSFRLLFADGLIKEGCPSFDGNVESFLSVSLESLCVWDCLAEREGFVGWTRLACSSEIPLANASALEPAIVVPEVESLVSSVRPDGGADLIRFQLVQLRLPSGTQVTKLSGLLDELHVGFNPRTVESIQKWAYVLAREQVLHSAAPMSPAQSSAPAVLPLEGEPSSAAAATVSSDRGYPALPSPSFLSEAKPVWESSSKWHSTLEIEASLKSLSVGLHSTTLGRSLGVLAVQGVNVHIQDLSHGVDDAAGCMTVAGTLSSVSLLAPDHVKVYPLLVYPRADSVAGAGEDRPLVEFCVQSFQPGHPLAESHSTLVMATVRPLSVVYLHSEFMAMVSFLLDGVIGSLLMDAASAVKGIVKEAVVSNTALDISLESPEVTLPESNSSKHQLLVRVESVVLRNSLHHALQDAQEAANPPQALTRPDLVTKLQRLRQSGDLSSLSSLVVDRLAVHVAGVTASLVQGHLGSRTVLSLSEPMQVLLLRGADGSPLQRLNIGNRIVDPMSKDEGDAQLVASQRSRAVSWISIEVTVSVPFVRGSLSKAEFGQVMRTLKSNLTAPPQQALSEDELARTALRSGVLRLEPANTDISTLAVSVDLRGADLGLDKSDSSRLATLWSGPLQFMMATLLESPTFLVERDEAAEGEALNVTRQQMSVVATGVIALDERPVAATSSHRAVLMPQDRHLSEQIRSVVVSSGATREGLVIPSTDDASSVISDASGPSRGGTRAMLEMRMLTPSNPQEEEVSIDVVLGSVRAVADIGFVAEVLDWLTDGTASSSATVKTPDAATLATCVGDAVSVAEARKLEPSLTKLVLNMYRSTLVVPESLHDSHSRAIMISTDLFAQIGIASAGRLIPFEVFPPDVQSVCEKLAKKHPSQWKLANAVSAGTVSEAVSGVPSWWNELSAQVMLNDADIRVDRGELSDKLTRRVTVLPSISVELRAQTLSCRPVLRGLKSLRFPRKRTNALLTANGKEGVVAHVSYNDARMVEKILDAWAAAQAPPPASIPPLSPMPAPLVPLVKDDEDDEEEEVPATGASAIRRSVMHAFRHGWENQHPDEYTLLVPPSMWPWDSPRPCAGGQLFVGGANDEEGRFSPGIAACSTLGAGGEFLSRRPFATLSRQQAIAMLIRPGDAIVSNGLSRMHGSSAMAQFEEATSSASDSVPLALRMRCFPVCSAVSLPQGLSVVLINDKHDRATPLLRVEVLQANLAAVLNPQTVGEGQVVSDGQSLSSMDSSRRVPSFAALSVCLDGEVGFGVQCLNAMNSEWEPFLEPLSVQGSFVALDDGFRAPRVAGELNLCNEAPLMYGAIDLSMIRVNLSQAFYATLYETAASLQDDIERIRNRKTLAMQVEESESEDESEEDDESRKVAPFCLRNETGHPVKFLNDADLVDDHTHWLTARSLSMGKIRWSHGRPFELDEEVASATSSRSVPAGASHSRRSTDRAGLEVGSPLLSFPVASSYDDDPGVTVEPGAELPFGTSAAFRAVMLTSSRGAVSKGSIGATDRATSRRAAKPPVWARAWVNSGKHPTPAFRVDRTGVTMFSLPLSEGAMAGGSMALTAQVTVVDGRRVVILRSAVQVHNHSSIPLEVIVADEDGKPRQSIGVVLAGANLAVPAGFADSRVSLRVRPVPSSIDSGEVFDMSTPIHLPPWRDRRAASVLASLVCSPRSKGSGVQFPLSFAGRAYRRADGAYTAVSIRPPMTVTNLLPRRARFAVREFVDTSGTWRETFELNPGEHQDVYRVRYNCQPQMSIIVRGLAPSPVVTLGPGARAMDPRYEPLTLLPEGAGAAVQPSPPQGDGARIIVETTAGGGADELEAAAAGELARGYEIPARAVSAKNRAVVEGKSPKDPVERAYARLRTCVWATHWISDRSGAGLTYGVHLPASLGAGMMPSHGAWSAGRPPKAIALGAESHGCVPVFIRENQRYSPLTFGESWSSRNLLPTDPWGFTDMTGRHSVTRAAVDRLPDGWEWVGPWTLVNEHPGSDEGWDYELNWGNFDSHVREFKPKAGATDFVRRRTWVRLKRRLSSRQSKAWPDSFDVTMQWAKMASAVAVEAAMSSRTAAVAAAAAATPPSHQALQAMETHLSESTTPSEFRSHLMAPFGNAALFTPSEVSAAAHQTVYAALGSGPWSEPLKASEEGTWPVRVSSAANVATVPTGRGPARTLMRGQLDLIYRVQRAPAPFDRTMLLSFSPRLWLVNATPFQMLYRDEGVDLAHGLQSFPARRLGRGAAVPIHQDDAHVFSRRGTSTLSRLVSVSPHLPGGLSGWSCPISIEAETTQAIPLLVPLKRQAGPMRGGSCRLGEFGLVCRRFVVLSACTIRNPKLPGGLITIVSLPSSSPVVLPYSNDEDDEGGSIDTFGSEASERLQGDAISEVLTLPVEDEERALWVVENQSSQLLVVWQQPTDDRRPRMSVLVPPGAAIPVGLSSALDDSASFLRLAAADMPSGNLADAVAAGSIGKSIAFDMTKPFAELSVSSAAGKTVLGRLESLGDQRRLRVSDSAVSSWSDTSWGLSSSLKLSQTHWDESLSLSVKGAEASVIDHRPKEVLVGSIKQVHLTTLRVRGMVVNELKVMHYALDDADQDAQLPVILCPLGRERGWLDEDELHGLEVGGGDLSKLAQRFPGAFSRAWALHVDFARRRHETDLIFKRFRLCVAPVRLRLSYSLLDRLFGLWSVAERTVQVSGNRLKRIAAQEQRRSERPSSSATRESRWQSMLEGLPLERIDPDLLFDGPSEPMAAGTPVTAVLNALGTTAKDASSKAKVSALASVVTAVMAAGSQHTGGYISDEAQASLRRFTGGCHAYGTPETLLPTAADACRAASQGWTLDRAGKLPASLSYVLSGTCRAPEAKFRWDIQAPIVTGEYTGRSGRALLLGDAPFALPGAELCGVPLEAFVTPRKPLSRPVFFDNIQVDNSAIVVDYMYDGTGMSDRGLGQYLSEVSPVVAFILRSGVSLDKMFLDTPMFSNEDWGGSIDQLQVDYVQSVASSWQSSGKLVSLVSTFLPGARALGRLGHRWQRSVATRDNPLEAAAGVTVAAAGVVTDTAAGVTGMVGGLSRMVGRGVAFGVGKALGDEKMLVSAQASTQQRPQNVVSGVSRGVKDIAGGVWSGVSGVIARPFTGAREGGLGGFVKGLGRGVAGVVVDPLVGVFNATGSVLEGVTGTVEGMGRIADHEGYATLMQSFRLGRSRIPRAFYDVSRAIRPYSEVDAIAAMRLNAGMFRVEDDLVVVGVEPFSSVVEVLTAPSTHNGTFLLATAEALVEVTVPEHPNSSRIVQSELWVQISGFELRVDPGSSISLLLARCHDPEIGEKRFRIPTPPTVDQRQWAEKVKSRVQDIWESELLQRGKRM
jgi:hypothetical protein